MDPLGDYVRVVTEEDSNLVLSTMKALRMIYLKQFVRVHKSYIINIDRVERSIVNLLK
jgi:DNA-binding LytR/AlgR family response regulator